MNTPKQIKKEFNALLAVDLSFKNAEATKEYYSSRELFQKQLAAFVLEKGNMSGLTTNQLLHICRMVGTYQPMALHVFLIKCANEVEG